MVTGQSASRRESTFEPVSFLPIYDSLGFDGMSAELNKQKPMQAEAGSLPVSTLDEMICRTAFLAYDQNTAQHYRDFAALTERASPETVLDALRQLDARYGALQTASIGLEVAKALCAAAPFDLNQAEWPDDQGLDEEWHRWETIREICNRYGLLLGEALVLGEE